MNKLSENSKLNLFYYNNRLYVKKTAKNELGTVALRNEIKQLEKINSNSAGFISFYDLNADFTNPYIVMDCKGQSLRYLMNNNLLTISFSSLVIKIINELNSFGSDFFHGDIKPENIMLYKNQIQLIDFGTSNHNSIYYYSFTKEMSNKQAVDGRKSSFSSDLYAFAITIMDIANYYCNKSGINYSFYDLINNLLSEKNYLLFSSWEQVKNAFYDVLNKHAYETPTYNSLITDCSYSFTTADYPITYNFTSDEYSRSSIRSCMTGTDSSVI